MRGYRIEVSGTITMLSKPGDGALRAQLMRLHHNDKPAGHFGRDSTHKDTSRTVGKIARLDICGELKVSSSFFRLTEPYAMTACTRQCGHEIDGLW